MSEQQEETFSSTENNNLDSVNNNPTNDVQPVVAVDDTGDVISDINQRISNLEHNMRNDMVEMRNDMDKKFYDMSSRIDNLSVNIIEQGNRSDEKFAQMLAESDYKFKQMMLALQDNKLSTEKNFREVHERMDRIEERAAEDRESLHYMHNRVQSMPTQPALPDVDVLNDLVKDVVNEQLSRVSTSLVERVERQTHNEVSNVYRRVEALESELGSMNNALTERVIEVRDIH